MIVSFFVKGNPVPKQSTRFDGNGHAHTDPRVAAWERLVADESGIAMFGRDLITGPVEVELTFYLPDNRRRDGDNLSKGTLDGMRKIVYLDDNQVVDLHIHKRVGKPVGVQVEVREK